MITVVEVIRQMGIEPASELSWSVGSRVRDLYESRCGSLPEKDLRQKTSGSGSHCFAVYPESMREEIVSIIKAHQTESTRQPDLFGEKE